jgi:cytochrome P450 family 144
LARQADLQERLRRHPERIPAALEDILRDDGPFQFHYRWTTTDTSLKDVPIPANSRVLLLWAAANRPSPQEPGSAHHDVDDADPGAHFAFGRGLHFCIGAPLARLESRIAIERLLSQTSCISLDPDHPPVRRPSILLRRHASLPVILTGGR